MHFDIGDKILEKRDCGCLIFQRSSLMTGETRIDIHYCPKHSASFEMYEALTAIKEDGKVKADFWKLRHKALVKADNKRLSEP